MPHKLHQIIVHPFVQHKPFSFLKDGHKFPKQMSNIFLQFKHDFCDIFSIFKCKAATCLQFMCLKEYSREVLAQESADFTQGPLMSSCKHF